MPKFYCDYCDTYLTHDSPSVRKTHCSGRKHKENVKDYYQKWMEEQAQSLIDKTTRENPTDSVLGTTSCRSHDTPSAQHPWAPQAGHDAGPAHGRPPHDADDGPPTTGNDASRTCARDAPAHGGPHAHDAGTPHDETPLPPHDGANPAGNDPSRQIKGEAEPPFLVRVKIFCTIKYRRPESLGFCIKLVCRGNLLLDRRRFDLAAPCTGAFVPAWILFGWLVSLPH